jgi:uroporphyrinogen-III synthase
MAELVQRHGGEPVVAPAMREVPVQGSDELLSYLARLEAGDVDVVVLMTGVGLRALSQAVAGEWPRDRLAAALGKATLVARGPKPAAALRELGLQADVTVPEPNTFREIIAAMDAHLPVRGKLVAVQEYGVGNSEFLQALEARGARVLRVRIYRWALPEDLAPLRAAIREIAAGRIDVALFTSATQVYHLFEVAAEDTEALRSGLQRIAVGSIGPVCSAALQEHGVAPDFEPEQGKMGRLVRAAALRAATLVHEKRKGLP